MLACSRYAAHASGQDSFLHRVLLIEYFFAGRQSLRNVQLWVNRCVSSLSPFTQLADHSGGGGRGKTKSALGLNQIQSRYAALCCHTGHTLCLCSSRSLCEMMYLKFKVLLQIFQIIATEGLLPTKKKEKFKKIILVPWAGRFQQIA